jgi:uncharacterized protein
MGAAGEVTIISKRPTGDVELEGRLSLPQVSKPVAGAVICHPHPAGGGAMDVGLLEVMDRRMVAAGLGVLRFNFAGVAGSCGAFTDGVDEPLDVAAAFEFLRSHPSIDETRVSLAGWSFGAWMALLALADGVPADRCVAIAPPLSLYDWQPSVGRIAASKAERHYVIGTDDQFCPLEDIREFAEALSAQDADNVMALPSTDHFMFGREDMVAELAIEFIES